MNKYGYIVMVLIIFLSIPYGIAHIDGPAIKEIGTAPYGKTYIKVVEIEDPSGVDRVEVLKGSKNLKFSLYSVFDPKDTYLWTADGKSNQFDEKLLDGYWWLKTGKMATKKMTLYLEYTNPHIEAELTLRAMGADLFWSGDIPLKNGPAKDKEGGSCIECHSSIGGVQVPTDKLSLLYRIITNSLKFE